MKKAILLLVTLLAAVASATNYYVATDGNDANDGSSGHPWLTTTKAGNTAVAGDTVYFGAGTYAGQLAPINSGSSGSGYITFKAIARRTAIINNGNTGASVRVDTKSYIRIEGFELTNGWSGVYCSDANYIQIVDNYIHGLVGPDAQGIYTSYQTTLYNSVIQDNNICDVNGNGILLDVNNVIIKNNDISYNTSDCMMVSGVDILIENNFCHGYWNEGEGHQDGINVISATDCIIRNNLVYGFTQDLYFPPKDGDNNVLINLYVYGNVCLDGIFWQTIPGKGIFIDARKDDTVLSNIQIHSNIIGCSGFAAISILTNDVTSVSNIKVYNNVGYNDNATFSGVQITASKEGQITSNYNDFFGYSKPTFEGTNTITTDPCFVDYVIHDINHINMRLKSTSLAINTGDPNLATEVNLPSPFTDINDVNRPQGTRYDMGAYEYTEATAAAIVRWSWMGFFFN